MRGEVKAKRAGSGNWKSKPVGGHAKGSWIRPLASGPEAVAPSHLVVKHSLRVAAFVVALHRQPGELHSVPLQRCGVHGAKPARREKGPHPEAPAARGAPGAGARTRERRGRSAQFTPDG